MHSLISNNNICLVAGDSNFDNLKYERSSVINEFLNLVYSNFFQPYILEPTRVVLNSRPSLIGNIYIDTYNKAIHRDKFLDKVTNHTPNSALLKTLLN